LQFLACIEEGLKYDERKVRQAQEDSSYNAVSPQKQPYSHIISLADDKDEGPTIKSAVLSQQQEPLRRT
jgi:hypothetical protein